MFLFIFMLCLSVPAGLFAAPVTLTDVTQFTATGTNPGGDLDDYGWGDVNKLDGITDYVAWTHHFVFEPPANDLLYASLTVNLYDDERDKFFNPFTWEAAIGWGESGQWTVDDVDTGAYQYDINVNYLLDGSFSVTLASAWGDFYIQDSTLKIDYESAPVPEPATLVLLGSGLLGLAGFRRKKS